ncbi:MAG: HesA/MoeB/ThiF family protein [Bacteroidota bacterium]|nr:HesA/MoeB/ThiF family protein [Bacteroidota bacterium]
MLTQEEIERYIRQIQIPSFGQVGQIKLKQAKILVVGLGGLGSVASVYLVAAGIGTVGIMDKDKVTLHNLQRQVLYREDQEGESKLVLAQKSLQKLNSKVKINAYECFLTNDNAKEIIKEYDIVLDCTDNYSTRYLINDTCVELGKPFIYGTIGDTKGQMAVFNYGDKPANYRDLYPKEELLKKQGNINKGVLGVLPSVIASLQVNEVVKMVTNLGEVMKDTLFMIDLLTLETLKFRIQRRDL